MKSGPQEERAEDARPELASAIENLDQYSTIFLGYPSWNSDLPMPLYSFLEQTDLAGKTIIPLPFTGEADFPERFGPSKNCSRMPR